MGFFDNPLNFALLLLVVGIVFLAWDKTSVWVDENSKIVGEVNPTDSSQLSSLSLKYQGLHQVSVSRLQSFLAGFLGWVQENALLLIVLVVGGVVLFLASQRKTTAIKQVRTLSEQKLLHEKFAKNDPNYRVQEATRFWFYEAMPEFSLSSANDKGVWIQPLKRVVNGLPVTIFPSELFVIYSNLREAGVAAGTPFRGVFSKRDLVTWLRVRNLQDLSDVVNGYQVGSGVTEDLRRLIRSGDASDEVVEAAFKTQLTQGSALPKLGGS